MTTQTPIQQRPPLTGLDRCDKCGAQAYFRAIMLSGLELTFCLHHGSKLAGPLVAHGIALFEDYTNLLEK
jgi:hypothetical protein